MSTETENFPAAENDDPATSGGHSSAVTADGGGEPVAFCAHCDHPFAAGDSLAHDCGPVEPVADTEAVETVRRVPEESYTITTECRANRGDGGAWDEAVARLRVVYNAQLARFGPAAVYRLEFHREPAPGVPRYVYDAARDSRPVALPTARDGESDPEDYCHRCGGPNICWHAPNDTWNAGVGTPEDPRGNTLILCPVCFVQQYEQRHGESIWKLTAREGETGGRAIYLAARYSRNDEMRGVRDVLSAIGYRITSRWIDQHNGELEKSFTPEALSVDPEGCAPFGIADVEDLRAADIVVSFTSRDGGGKGGRHVEFGMALGLGKRLIVVGPRENIFHTLPEVEHYPNWSRLVMALTRESRSAGVSS